MSDALASSAAVAAECAALRLIPFALYAGLRAHAPRAQRMVAFGSVASLGLAPWLLHIEAVAIPALIGVALALAYVPATTLIVHPLSRHYGLGRVTRPALVLAMVVIYLLVPSVLLSGRARIDCLTLGWEAALAGYSYCIEGSRLRAKWRDCLFFMVVNPLLVYAPPVRVREAQPPLSIVVGRIALGVVVTWAAFVLVHLMAAAPVLTMWHPRGPYAGFLLQGVVVFVLRYAALSGVASMQWGAMRWIGYEVPERYRHPYLATSPLDFFRRWNLYVGAWFGRYVFQPLGRHVGKRWPGLRPHAVPSALAATMISVGVFHDAFVYASDLRWSFDGTQAFGFAALMMVAWAATASRWNAWRANHPPRLRPEWVWRAFARLLVFHMVCVFAALFAH